MVGRTALKRTLASALALGALVFLWHVYNQEYGAPVPPKKPAAAAAPNAAANRAPSKSPVARKPATRPTTVVVHRAPVDPFNLYERAGQPRRLEGHTDTVRSAALSADKTRLVTGGNDRTVRLWDFSTGKELRNFEGHGEFVVGVDISRDGSRILSCGDDETMRVWDANTGEQLSQLEGNLAGVIAASFMPNPNFAVTVSEDSTVRLWDIEKEASIQTIDFEHSVCSAAINLPHQLLAVGTHSGHVYLVDLKSFKKLGEVFSIDSCIPRLAFSADATMLAIKDEKGVCRVINIATRAKLFQDDGQDTSKTTGMAFSSDGKYLALTRHQVLFETRFYDLKTGEPSKTNITSGSFAPHQLLFVPDSSQLVTVGGGYMYGNRQWLHSRRDKVLVWDLPNPLP